MYKDFFGLREMPFSIAPDPRYLYLSAQHREALAHLLYGINSDGGFVLLTGEVGTGKTTVCRCLLEQVPEKTDIAFIYNPKLTVDELLASVCDELRIQYPSGNRSVKVFIDCINAYLLDNFAKGRKTVIILEEAQNLSSDVLEEIRLLTNLETNRQKLLQIIMVGQPELKEMLSRPELRQLSQRITARYHLEALSVDETGPYINHRLESAGANKVIFPDNLMKHIYRMSKGVPRLINLICDRALLGAYTEGKNVIEKKILIKAASEVSGENRQSIFNIRVPGMALTIFLLIAFSAAAGFYFYNDSLTHSATQKPATPSPVQAKTQEPVKTESLGALSSGTIDNSKQRAFNEMLREWKTPPDSGYDTNVCGYINRYGLKCLEGSGSFKKVMALNRPAVLKMYLENGKPYHLFLKAVQDKTALVVIGDEMKRVELKEIMKRFSGEYAIFWKTPPGYRELIHPGEKTPVAEWLEARLSSINKRSPISRKDNVYDSRLVDEVKKFQSSAGIPAVGLVGPKTVIHINNATGSDEPQLAKKAEGS